MFKSRPPIHWSTLTVTSCRRPVLEGVTTTPTMSNRPKTHPQAWPTHRTLRDTPVNWKQCTRSWRERLTPSSDQHCFSPTTTSSKFRSLPTPIPSLPKTSKTVAPRRQSTPSHTRRTQRWKKNWLPWPSLRHTPALRPNTPLSKRVWETSRMSAS